MRCHTSFAYWRVFVPCRSEVDTVGCYFYRKNTPRTGDAFRTTNSRVNQLVYFFLFSSRFLFTRYGAASPVNLTRFEKVKKNSLSYSWEGVVRLLEVRGGLRTLSILVSRRGLQIQYVTLCGRYESRVRIPNEVLRKITVTLLHSRIVNHTLRMCFEREGKFYVL